MAVTKPILNDDFVWASGAQEGDIVIPYDKIDAGWGYANKPAYQYLNWFWNTQSAFYAHLNQNGIPEWDEETIYASSGFVKYDGLIYQSFSETQASPPMVDSRVWSSLEFVNGLVDVEIDQPGFRDILYYDNGVWENDNPGDVADMDIGDISNVSVNPQLETIMAVNDANQDATNAWSNLGMDTILVNKLNISDTEDTRITDPQPGEILQFRPIEIWLEDDEVYQDQWRWQNTYYQGYVNYNNITNIPYEFQPPRASRDVVGGARMWVDTASETYPIFNVSTEYETYVSPPYGLKATDDEVEVRLEWEGSKVTDKYNIYRDGSYYDSTVSTETTYTDVSAGTGWHVYYVTAIDSVSGTDHESFPSNYVMGRVKV